MEWFVVSSSHSIVPEIATCSNSLLRRAIRYRLWRMIQTKREASEPARAHWVFPENAGERFQRLYSRRLFACCDYQRTHWYWIGCHWYSLCLFAQRVCLCLIVLARAWRLHHLQCYFAGGPDSRSDYRTDYARLSDWREWKKHHPDQFPEEQPDKVTSFSP